MEEKYQKWIAGIGITVMVAGSVWNHDQFNLGLAQVTRIHEDHIPESPYQYTRTSYPTTSIVSGSTTTTTTAP